MYRSSLPRCQSLTEASLWPRYSSSSTLCYSLGHLWHAISATLVLTERPVGKAAQQRDRCVQVLDKLGRFEECPYARFAGSAVMDVDEVALVRAQSLARPTVGYRVGFD